MACSKLSLHDSQAWFPPSPPLTSCPRGKRWRGKTDNISASLNSAHVPNSKELMEKEGTWRVFSHSCLCALVGIAEEWVRYCSLAVTLSLLKHKIFWPLLIFWQQQREAVTRANGLIWGTALKEFACFVFHTANQIKSSLSLMLYINMSFVYIPWQNAPKVRKRPCLESLVLKSGNESAVLKLCRQTD